jgi:hypothetical protein
MYIRWVHSLDREWSVLLLLYSNNRLNPFLVKAIFGRYLPRINKDGEVGKSAGLGDIAGRECKSGAPLSDIGRSCLSRRGRTLPMPMTLSRSSTYVPTVSVRLYIKARTQLLSRLIGLNL